MKNLGLKFVRASRLLKPAEFKRVFGNPIRSGDASFRVLARSSEFDKHRLGMAVAKKACQKAVGRNRIKRVIRESFRVGLANRQTDTALDFVVLPTAQAKDQSNEVLSDSLNAHWEKLTKKAAAAHTGQRIKDTH